MFFTLPVNLHVMAFVFSCGHQLKVFYSVIQFILVNVMHDLTRIKLSSQVSFHDPTVFAFRNVIFTYHSIAVTDPSRMIGSLSERMRIASFLPAAKVLYAEALHVMRGFAHRTGTFSFFSHNDEVYA